jgi:putative holliday junction resolvase
MSRILALDYSKNRVGLAICDQLRITVTPYKTIKNRSMPETLAELETIISQERVNLVVIGIPYHFDGSASKQTNLVKAFIESAKEFLKTKIDTFDERYSSSEAKEIMLKGNYSLQKDKDKIDQIAAAIILQNYINNFNRNNLDNNQLNDI